MQLFERRVHDIPMRWAERGRGPAVVFIHGIPTSPRLWRHVLPRVPDARCLAWEMVGYGSSIDEGRGRHISVSRQADYMLAWLDDLDVRRAVLVGHDLGGGVAQIAAVRRPDLCAGLVLTNAVAYDSWPVPEVKAIGLLGPALDWLPDVAFAPLFRRFVRLGHDDPVRAAESARLHWKAYAGHGGATALVRQINSLNVQDTLAIAEALPALSVPAQVVWGAADSFQTLEYGERLSHDLRTPLRRVEKGRHFMPEDHPDAIAEAVLDVLKAAASARAPAAAPRPGARRDASPRPEQRAPEEPARRAAEEPSRRATGEPDRRATAWELTEQEKLPPRGTARGETDPRLEPRPGTHPPPRDPAPRRAPKDLSPGELDFDG